MDRRQNIVPLLLALIALGVGVMAQRCLTAENLRDGLILYALAAGLFVYATRRANHEGRITRGESRRANGLMADSRNRDSVVLSLLLALAAGAFSLAGLILFRAERPGPAAWWAYLGSVVLGLATAWVSERRMANDTPRNTQHATRITHHESQIANRKSEKWPWLSVWYTRTRDEIWVILRLPRRKGAGLGRRWEFLALMVILVLAAFMRLYRFDSLPFGTWYDEADNGLWAQYFLHDPTYRPLYVASTNLPAHFLYLITLSFRLFGVSTQSIRLVTVAFGLGTVLVGYAFGRQFFGPRGGLALAFLLAVSRWNVNFSRFGVHGISTPFFELLVLYFLLKALKSGKSWHWAWAGAALGLGLCFYAPFRLFPVVVAFFLVYQGITQRRQGFLRRHYPGLLLMVFLLWLAVAPVVQFACQHPDVFWKRAKQISIWKDRTVTDVPQAILDNIRLHALMFNYHGDNNGRHNLPGAPMLDFFSGVLFVLGMAASLARWRQPKYALLPVWWAVMLCGGVFALHFEAPQSLRAIGTMPVAYVLASVPLHLLAQEWEAVRPRRVDLSPLVVGICVLLFSYIAGDNFTTYFHRQARDFSVWAAFSTKETILAQEVKRLMPYYDIYLAPTLTGHLTTRFLAPEFDSQTPFDPAAVFPLPTPSPGKEGIILFIDNDTPATVRNLAHRYYPGVQERTYDHPLSGLPVLYALIFSYDEVTSLQGLQARYMAADGSRTQRVDRALDFTWPEDAPVELPFTVEWNGVLRVPEYGTYTLMLEGGETCDLWLDDALTPLGGTGEEARLALARGNHALRLRCQVEQPGSLRLLWQLPQAPEPELIGPEALYHDPLTGHGLLGRYYPNGEWQEPPAFLQLDPMIAYYFHFIPLQRPYTVEWTGRLVVPQSGVYRLGTEALSASWLYVDGKLVLENTAPNTLREEELTLAAGFHELRLRFLDAGDHSHIYLYWTPPGGVREYIPIDNLLPPPTGAWESAD